MSLYTASDDLAVVYVTAEEANAQNLASGLVEAELAACVNIVPGTHKVVVARQEAFHWCGYSCAYALQPYRDYLGVQVEGHDM